MKNKIKKSFLVAVIILMAAISIYDGVFANDEARDETIEQIYDYEMNRFELDTMKDFVNEELIRYSGVTPAEWFMISFYEDGLSLDYEKYNSAVDEFLKEKESELNPCDLLRIALYKSCVGTDPEWVEKVIEEQTGKMGIMSCIYGLILHDGRDYQTDITGPQIAEMILEFQLENGGFALSGEIPDPDVTAMALQALSGYYSDYESQIEAALDCLSQMQQEDGGFLSYGVETSESSAQVLLALLSLKINYTEDLRFLKNNNSVYDSLMSFQDESGGFCHEKGQKTNEISTSQALMALVGIKKTEEREKNFFDFRGDEVPMESVEANELKTKEINGAFIKKAFIIGLAMVCVLGTGILLIMKKGKKSLLIWLAINLAAFVFLLFSNFQTVDEYYESTEGGTMSVVVSIEGPDGAICSDVTVWLEKDASAFEALEIAAKMKRINVDYTGSKALSNIYVKSIDGISEFDYGKLSGWTYSVNDVFPNVSAGACQLEEKDVVKWIYQKEN